MDKEKKHVYNGHDTGLRLADYIRRRIGQILDEGVVTGQERKTVISELLQAADYVNVKPYAPPEIPTEVLEDYYEITAPVNWSILADMTYERAYHWLANLRICAGKVRQHECDGDIRNKSDPNAYPCTLCSKKRAVEFGLLLL